MTLKVLVKFDTKLLKNRSRAKKIRTWVSEDFLGPKVTTPQIWGSTESSAGLGVFLKICSCQLFFKKNFSHFLLLFFAIFFQKLSKSQCQKFGRKWPISLNFFKNMLFEVFRHHVVHIILYYWFCEFLWLGQKVEILAKKENLTTCFIAETFFSNKTCG